MRSKDYSNEHLLTLYSKGSFEAFHIFYKKHSKLIFLFILSRLKNKEEAEEVLQETFFRVHKYIHRYDPQKKALNWVLTIAKNQIITRISKRKDFLELDDSLLKDTKYLYLETKDELQKILSVLSKEDQAIIIDKFLKEETYEEISKKRNLNPVNTRQKVSRILKKLRSQ